jgi:tryptophan synthase
VFFFFLPFFSASILVFFIALATNKNKNKTKQQTSSFGSSFLLFNLSSAFDFFFRFLHNMASEGGVARLRSVFAKAKSEGHPAFVAYVTVGFPSISQTVPILLALEKGGADVIELGVPHTDPLADGPVIQHSNNIALSNGVTPSTCLQVLREARKKGLKTPVILMGYYNPFRAYGEDKLIDELKTSGGDGFIVVDLPPEDSSSFRKKCSSVGLSLIPFVASTTSDHRLDFIRRTAIEDAGFIYCISLLGVTGARTELPHELPAFVSHVRDHIPRTSAPLAVGFGISTPEQFREVGKFSEGVVIGSAIVKVGQLFLFLRLLLLIGFLFFSLSSMPIVDCYIFS